MSSWAGEREGLGRRGTGMAISLDTFIDECISCLFYYMNI